MESVKDKIKRIKLARMGEEYRFVADIFSNLVPHTSDTKPNNVYFMKNNIPIMVYDKKSNYLWCSNNDIWEPLFKIIIKKMEVGQRYNLPVMTEMRKIIGHFALGYFNISSETISMSHSFITNTWRTLKFKRVYVW